MRNVSPVFYVVHQVGGPGVHTLHVVGEVFEEDCEFK
ncbi:hypothetical protein Mal48_21120 [Thalassoglobus polymorphus]|uniref:Uncharacterized protein n=1 Tax=Thalassoglobus polymorphus TaxID=2527994 RepID=A0A517QMJ6_9PLAN|nr:hypothetical protein Mal48_21120 [Thalassoglobus polymorphus]